MSKRRIVTDPQNADADTSVIFILDNLSAGRTPEELISQNSGLSLAVIEAVKKRVLEVIIDHKDHSFFRSNLRIRHLIVALQPHPTVNIICEAFEGVRLGKGAGLRQMTVMENWGMDPSGKKVSNQSFAGIKREDETNQWEAVKIEDMDEYQEFCFCDAEGFRFYIPARLIYDLAGNDCGVLWYLDPGRETQEIYLRWYSLLNDQQRHAIASYLLHISKDIENSGASKEIANAFENFWMQYL